VKRRLFDLVTLLSLVLCVAVVALWVRSHSRADWVQWQRSQLSGPRQRQVIDKAFTAEGLLVFTRDAKRAEYEAAPGEETLLLFEPSGNPDGVRWDRFHPRSLLDGLNDSDYWPRYGFLAEVRGSEFGPHDGTWYTVLSLPLWGLTALSALLPSARLLSFVRRRFQMRPGLCPACAYDLRATPGRCPECGATAAAGRVRQ
jgi:hypothetical protein